MRPPLDLDTAGRSGLTMVREVVAIALALVALSVGLAAANDPVPLSAINEAGRQRMLTQRIVLQYYQIGLGVMPDQSRKRLSEAVALFESQLARLRGFAPDRRTHAALDRAGRIWRRFKKIATGPVDRSRAEELWSLGDDLLYACHKVVRFLQDASGTSTARLVNISGRQRMLSQRLAKFYMLKEWGFDSLTLRDEIEATRNEAAAAFRTLESARENTDEIRRELDRVALQWAWFVNALTLTGEEPYRLVVTDSSEEILIGMERITRLYEGLARP